MRTLFITIVLCWIPAGVFAADKPTASKKTYDSFRVIFERNIFSKDRLPPQSSQPSNRVARKQVLAIYVLRGTAAEAGRAHRFAFVEEQVSEQSQTVKVGDEILGGGIKGVYMNYVLFEQNGVVRKIKVGEEFGQTSTTVYTEEKEETEETKTAESSEQAVPEPDKSADPKESTTDENELLKQLMERRQRELGT